MGDSSHEGDSKHDTIEKPRGAVSNIPKRQFRLEEVLFRLGNKSFASKVVLVLEWSLAGAAIRRSCQLNFGDHRVSN
jgi:hypothetical protein